VHFSVHRHERAARLHFPLACEHLPPIENDKRKWCGGLQPIPRKTIELPPAVARRFAKRHACIRCWAEPHQARQDRGPANVCAEEYQGAREKPVRIPDIMEMFLQMSDHVLNIPLTKL
jgi:hypothetical protein